jgi:hypothetical protein
MKEAHSRTIYEKNLAFKGLMDVIHKVAMIEILPCNFFKRYHFVGFDREVEAVSSKCFHSNHRHVFPT